MFWVSAFQTVEVNKTNWENTDFINYDDFNRIERKMEELTNYLNYYQFKSPVINFITNRDIKSIDYLSSINRIENNLEQIKNNFVTPLDWQQKKLWSVGMSFTYEDANRLEENTERLMTTAMLATRNLKYTGTFNCGQMEVI